MSLYRAPLYCNMKVCLDYVPSNADISVNNDGSMFYQRGKRQRYSMFMFNVLTSFLLINYLLYHSLSVVPACPYSIVGIYSFCHFRGLILGSRRQLSRRSCFTFPRLEAQLPPLQLTSPAAGCPRFSDHRNGFYSPAAAPVF